MLLGALLQLGKVFLGAAVGLDGLLRPRGQLGLPVALARLLLLERVLLVLLVVLVAVCMGSLGLAFLGFFFLFSLLFVPFLGWGGAGSVVEGQSRRRLSYRPRIP